MKEFPEPALARIRSRATLLPVPGARDEELGPHRIKQEHLEKTAKEPKGFTKAIRATRSPDRLKRSA